MTKKEILKELESLGEEKVRKQNRKQGAGENQYGVRLGSLRKIAKKIKIDNALARELWKTDIVEARMLATLIMKPEDFSSEELDDMVRSMGFARVADWMNSYIVKNHPENEALRKKWMMVKEKNPMAARAGWNLTSQRVVREPDTVDISKLLDRIEKKMAKEDPLVQWTMNFTLANIGIHHPEHRKRAIDIGEELGIYSDYPTAKGCTSPYAPIWINEMVSRQEN